MGALHLSPFPLLEPGERVLAERRFVRAVCGKSWPSYRWFFSLPPVFDIGLYVTDRRVLALGVVFRLITQEFSQWVPGGGPDTPETIVETRLGKSPLLGPYLEVVSEKEGRVWLRSRRASIRYYMRSPESLQNLMK